MAKKRGAKPKSEPTEKVRIGLMFEAGEAAAIQSLAERSGLSLNELMRQLARWAVSCGTPGEPVFRKWQSGGGDRTVRGAQFRGTSPCQGCVTFGHASRVENVSGIDGAQAGVQLPVQSFENLQEYFGEYFFHIDLSGRDAVRGGRPFFDREEDA